MICICCILRAPKLIKILIEWNSFHVWQLVDAQPCPTPCDSMDCSPCRAPLSMGFSRKMGCHFLFQVEKEMAAHSSICLGNPIDGGAWLTTIHGVTPRDQTHISVSPTLAGRFFTSCTTWKALPCVIYSHNLDVLNRGNRGMGSGLGIRLTWVPHWSATT